MSAGVGLLAGLASSGARRSCKVLAVVRSCASRPPSNNVEHKNCQPVPTLRLPLQSQQPAFRTGFCGELEMVPEAVRADGSSLGHLWLEAIRRARTPQPEDSSCVLKNTLPLHERKRRDEKEQGDQLSALHAAYRVPRYDRDTDEELVRPA